ncbi:hypothetical protein J41TS2_24810 [Bacillus sonorensis]|uniref:hypothetical protein n=1 Tax=Bacillus sonorensis TaxID=119858 RepID=UPI001B12DA71|nr:hypothetical protein [Bacillus sonorensis]GIN67060.1 hypothetical protein J41TS2_24810 [Bacillus sonorensis]
MIWIVLACSIYNIMFSLVAKTSDLRSSVVFKVFPFFLGLGCLIYFLKITGLAL